MEFPIKILNQLRPILRGFRKAQKLTQADIAKRLGITQQSYAQLEANPAAASLERLFKVLAILQVDVVLKEREVAEKLVTTLMIDTVKNQSIPSETKAISMGQLGSDHSQVYPNTMNLAAKQLAMGSIKNISSTTTLSEIDALMKMNRTGLEQSMTCSDVVGRAMLEQQSAAAIAMKNYASPMSLIGLDISKGYSKVADITALNRADLDIAKACSATADITAMKRVDLEQLQGYSAAESLKKDFLEKSKAFDDMTNELSLAFSSLKKKR
ncbi:MAG: helix-turn-helix transcriptional regulator [Thiotrichaceae bacterium]|nr:helix-turn-helix transcriptional regulator [Thiotrichaceae bacterium]